MSNSIPPETLLCVENKWIEKHLKKGFSELSKSQIDSLIPQEHVWLGPRSVLEKTPSFRQLVVYCVVSSGESILVFHREVSNEARLKGRLSIGLGGHINIGDVVAKEGVINLGETIVRAAQRELTEELEWLETPRELRTRWIGCLRDDSTEVSTVHLGIIAMCDIGDAAGALRVREGASAFEHISRIRESEPQLESWSSLLLSEWHSLSSAIRSAG